MKLSLVKDRLHETLKHEYGPEGVEQAARKVTAAINGAIGARFCTTGIEDTMDTVNTILGGYGVETFRGREWVNRYWQDTNLVYVNMGDTYVPTVLYDPLRNKWIIGDWGSFVEQHEKQFNNY